MLKLDTRTYRALAGRGKITLDDFSGGLNLRDFPNCEPNELLRASNVHIEGKMIVAARGTTDTTKTIAGQSIRDVFWTDVLNCPVARCTNGTLYNLNTGVALAGAPAVGTTSMWIVDFNGILVLGSRTAGIYTCTAGGVWALATAGIKPAMLAVWQNKVWAIGDPAFPDRLWASNAGNAAVWTVGTDFNEIPEGGTRGLTCIISTQEQDYLGRPSLIVYKRRATVRINSSNATTGFTYTILAVGAGCFGRRAAVADVGLVAAVDDTGIWTTDGVGTPKLISDKISPLFGLLQLNTVTSSASDCDSGISSVVRGNKFYWAISSGSSFTQRILVWDKRTGAFTFYQPTTGDGITSLTNMLTLYRDSGAGSTSYSIYCVEGWLPDNKQYRLDDFQTNISKDNILIRTAYVLLDTGSKARVRRTRIDARLGEDLAVRMVPNWRGNISPGGVVLPKSTYTTPPQVQSYDMPISQRVSNFPVSAVNAVAYDFAMQNNSTGAPWFTETDNPTQANISAPFAGFKPLSPLELYRITLYLGPAGRS